MINTEHIKDDNEQNVCFVKRENSYANLNNNDNCESEYIKDILNFLKLKEFDDTIVTKPKPDRYEIITENSWVRIILYIHEIYLKLHLSIHTFMKSVYMVYRVFSLINLKKEPDSQEFRLRATNYFDLIALVSLIVCSKYEEDETATYIQDFIICSSYRFNRGIILKTESKILKMLDWKIGFSNAIEWIGWLYQVGEVNMYQHTLAQYLIQISVINHEIMKYPPSKISASSIYLSRISMGETEPWSEALIFYTTHTEHDIIQCAKVITYTLKNELYKAFVDNIKSSLCPKSRILTNKYFGN